MREHISFEELLQYEFDQIWKIVEIWIKLKKINMVTLTFLKGKR